MVDHECPYCNTEICDANVTNFGSRWLHNQCYNNLNTELAMLDQKQPLAADVAPHDIVKITTNMKNGKRTFTVYITAVEHRNDHKGRPGRSLHHIQAKGHADESGQCGCVFVPDVATEYGVQSVEIIAKNQPNPNIRHHWYPRPGDRGYDLMC